MSQAAHSEPSPTQTPSAPDMTERIAADLEDNPLCHEWIIAAEVRVDNKTARRASFRGSYRAEEGQRVDALETYCRKCKRPLDEVGDEDCSAKIDNTHLIGGNPGERAKRKVAAPRGRVEHVAIMPRRHMPYGGYSVHSSKV